MKDVDEAVERVLRGMGGVEAPEGMERRVLVRVEAAAAVRESRFGGGFAGVRWAGLGLAAAVLLMVVGGLAWRERAGRGAMAVVMVPAASTRTAPVPILGAAAVQIRVQAPVRETAATAGGGGRPVVAGRGRRVMAGEGRTVLAGGGVGTLGGARAQGESSTAGGANALGDFTVRGVTLVNRPAPEEPLTAEERMLLRIARRGRPEEYVALDPGVEEARISEEKADVRHFFEPSTVNKENE